MQPEDMNKAHSNSRLSLLIEGLEPENGSFNKKPENIENETNRISCLKKRGQLPKESRISKKTVNTNPSERIHRVIAFRKILIASFLALSLFFHFLFIEGLYLVSQNKDAVTKDRKAIKNAFKINPPEGFKVRKKITHNKSKPKTKAEKTAIVSAKTNKRKLKKMSTMELEALGKRHMGMVRKGAFPPLILSYRSPASYVREMYDLGAKTVVYSTSSRNFHEIDLLGGDIFPLNSNDFKGFSSFKRVIKDSQWNRQKMRAASLLKTSPDSLEILLLVPLPIEMRWIGHQVNLFRQMDINVSEIETVEALFQDAILKLKCIHLKDGTTRYVNDYGCA